MFVGNINYDATEDQLRDIFSQVGTVVNFRVVYDQDSGRPKGYGFCEYEDAETAMSARRNLNGYELNGRQLRVDFTESDKSANSATGSGSGQGGSGGVNRATIAPPSTVLQIPDVLSGPNPSIAVLTLPQIHDVMLQLRKAVTEYNKETRELFLKNPQFAHAVLQGLIMLGLVPLPPLPPQPQVSVAGVGRAAGLPQPGMPSPALPQPGLLQPGLPQPGIPQGIPQSGLHQPGMQQPGFSQSGMTVGAGLPIQVGGRMTAQQQLQNQPSQLHAMSPNVPSMPPSMQGAHSHGQGTASLPILPVPVISQGHGNPQQPLLEQAALLRQIMELTPEQIEQLPPEQRSQVLQLQALASVGVVQHGPGGTGVGAEVAGIHGRNPFI